MGAGDGAQLGRLAQAGEGREFADVVFISAAGFGIGAVGEPFELGRHVGEIAILDRRQLPRGGRRRVPNSNQVLFHPLPHLPF